MIRHHKCRISPNRKRRKIRRRESTLVPSQGKNGTWIHPLIPREHRKVSIAERTLEISLSRSFCLSNRHQRIYFPGKVLSLTPPPTLLDSLMSERVVYDVVLTINKNKPIGNLASLLLFRQFLAVLLELFFFFSHKTKFLCLWALKLKLILKFQPMILPNLFRSRSNYKQIY